MNDLRCGDVTVTDDGNLGLSIHVNGAKQVCLNSIREVALMRWIAEKHGGVETVVVSPNLTEADVELWKAIVDGHFCKSGNMPEAIERANEAINALKVLRQRITKVPEDK